MPYSCDDDGESQFLREPQDGFATVAPPAFRKYNSCYRIEKAITVAYGLEGNADPATVFRVCPSQKGFVHLTHFDTLVLEVLFYLRAMYTGCLLYTSPSPRDLSTSRMPSSA